MISELKQLIADQNFIRTWLQRINERDELQITEVMDLMRTNKEYKEFILNYAQGKINKINL